MEANNLKIKKLIIQMGSYLSREDLTEFEETMTKNRHANNKFLFIFFIVVIVAPQLLFYALRNFGQ